MNQQYFLRWNNHQPNFISVFSNLLTNESLVDVTLAAEGKHIQAHKVVLSACSNYFQTLFSVNPCRHPIVILKDISYNDLKYIVEFIYYGEVSVTEEQLSTVIKAAESLQIKGLANIQELNSSNTDNSSYIRRKRVRKSSTGSECTVTTDSFEEVEVVVPTNISSANSSLATNSATTVIASSSATYSPGTIPSIKSTSEEIENGATTCKRDQGTSGIQQTDNNDMMDISVKQKRPRILIRQPRVRKDFDGNGSDSDEFGGKHKITRQYSDPTPQNSSVKYTTSNRKQNKRNLLTVSPPLHLIKQHSDSDIINQQQQSHDTSARSDEFRHSASQTLTLPLKTPETRSNHCPVLRVGPALGCNHCWNTIDNHGRILRRKTKYHCPECRTNLCIVPCFQDFHDKPKTVPDDNHQENDRQGEYHESYQQTSVTPTNKNTSSV